MRKIQASNACDLISFPPRNQEFKRFFMFLVRLSPREALHMANPLYQILVPLGGWMNPSTQTANLGRLHRSSPPFQARSPHRTRPGSGRIEAQKRPLPVRKAVLLQAGFSAMVDPRPLSPSKSSQSPRPGQVKRAQKSKRARRKSRVEA